MADVISSNHPDCLFINLSICLWKAYQQPSDLCNQLEDILTNFALNDHSLVSLELSFKDLISPEYEEPLATLTWSLIVHQDLRVRVCGGNFFHILLKHSTNDPQFIGGRILPGLVTLSSDQLPEAKASALPGLIHIISHIGDDALRERATFQMLETIQGTDSEIIIHRFLTTLSLYNPVT